ncbi:MAG: hypothetical protein IPJ65_37455 [Archangiaceae bacterium]|nr:hypothetical protein [Archangiaceae bacterium]
MRLSWGEKTAYTGTGGECVITAASVVQPDAGLGEAVSYAYTGNRAGLIESVTGGHNPESFNYDGGFRAAALWRLRLIQPHQWKRPSVG